MVVTVNLNPNIDRLLKINGFSYGGMNRVAYTRDDYTSKGINVSLVLKELGIDSICTGLMPLTGGERAVLRLAEKFIKHDYIWQPGNMRINIKVSDAKTGIITEINEKGLPAEKSQLEGIKKKVLGYSKTADFIVFTGSMPPGCPPEYFGGLIKEANKNGAKCVLDAEGEALKKGIDGKPYFVKANLFELSTLTGKELKDENTIMDERMKIIRAGVNLICVSMGREGAVLTDGREAYRASAKELKAASPTGAGDSMVAGVISGLIRGAPLKEVLKTAVAAASATAALEGTCLMTLDLYREMTGKVFIDTIF